LNLPEIPETARYLLFLSERQSAFRPEKTRICSCNHSFWIPEIRLLFFVLFCGSVIFSVISGISIVTGGNNYYLLSARENHLPAIVPDDRMAGITDSVTYLLCIRLQGYVHWKTCSVCYQGVPKNGDNKEEV